MKGISHKRLTIKIAKHSRLAHVAAMCRVSSFSLLLAAMLLLPGFAIGQGVDTTPPRIVSLNISPTHIDTTMNAATVTVTLEVTDDLSGVAQFAPGHLSGGSACFSSARPEIVRTRSCCVC
jgi:hypothetical protein